MSDSHHPLRPFAVEDARQLSPSAARNCVPIREALTRVLPKKGTVLEIGSGTGEHVVCFAKALPRLVWLPSDPDKASRASIEAWIASQQRYRELTSTSNCTDFQTRRLDTRGRFADGGIGPVATLNGTLCSTNRPIIALLETHQQEDGSVRVPEALRPYLGGLDVLKPVTA